MIRTANIAVPLALALLAAACGDNGRGMRGEADSTDSVAHFADEDRDGKVTRDEAGSDPYLQASFDRYDANDDEALDRAEFARLEAQSSQRKAQQQDDDQPHQLRDKRDFPKSY